MAPVAPPIAVDPYLDQPQTFDDMPKSRSKNKKRKKKRRKKREINYAAAFLPLGFGQFAHDKPLLGTAFLVGQAAGGGAYFYFKNKSDTAIEEANVEIAAQRKQIEQSDGASRIEAQEKLDQFIKETDAYTKGEMEKANYGLYAAIGLYALSIAEALVFGPAEPDPYDSWSLKIQKDPDKSFSIWSEDQVVESVYDQLRNYKPKTNLKFRVQEFNFSQKNFIGLEIAKTL